ncbi:helix-turn-helix transcriptional regulator [Candidatus Nitrotoga sp. AM1P]|uniref:helix-turn-helix transcriptional regulator n=1 Tax=Candidatus Nitrotoga sp. AM1P TaxID=2559597 RepID=UPI0010B2B644|nr:HTH domain-containing protein [Candidatus Nitrotoga sp. AM1P]BBJ24247.1 transcriptional regulator [Candidatus Nitrotoga sp. AM1P]
MLELLGSRQQELLKLLLKHKGGLTLEELSEYLKITRNAVRQHIAALENSGIVTQGVSRPSGGRPEQLYVLTDEGKEFFPRNYSWFAQLMVESIAQESGVAGLRERLGTMGEGVAQQLLSQNSVLKTREQKVEKLSEVMEALGYNTRSFTVNSDALTIEADNCIFHNLAMKNPEICQFDLALLSTFTDSTVNHEECMAKGGNVCRFKFKAKDE